MSQKRGFLNHIRPHGVSEKAMSFGYTFCLGGVSFLAFIVLGLTGILLMFHYLPGAKSGYASVTTLASVIPFGGLIRNLHFWAGQVMVVSVSLHMVRVVRTKSYRPPKEWNWLVGMSLLVLTLVLDFTGYLLRGSQESGAAAAVAVHILTLLPGIGRPLAQMFLGEVSAANSSTLMVYVWHCVALPFLALWLQMFHFWKIRKDGGVRPL
ncbi:menaquinol-cytochrome c reductase cytochrome b subunit [Peptococcaceae bacterium CEB3]|nr:menaquinol-cytochrome c reductase cytochrome b subunit [Peptococcaceae bacterium CEB3]